MTKIPFFTILIPNYRTEQFLEETLTSLLKQSFVDFECIVINDGSPGVDVQKITHNPDSVYSNNIIPQSVDLPSQCQFIFDAIVGKDARFNLIHKENGGQGSARNLGLDKAKGEFILFLDADDYYKHNHLELIYSQLQNYKSSWETTIFAYHDFAEFTVEKATEKIIPGFAIEQRAKNITLDTNLVFSQIGSTFCVIHRTLFSNLRFRPLCKTMEDVEIINRMFIERQTKKLPLKVKFISISDTIMHRRHGDSITTNDLASGSIQQAIDMKLQYRYFLQNYPLTFLQKLICWLGIIRFSLSPNKSWLQKYCRKVFTFVSKVISGWWW